jgi:preprotein translocase subunit YajC
MSLLIFPLLLGAMYFLMIRPQQKRVREQQELVDSLEVGDEVLTSAGMYGTVTLIDGQVMLLEIADGIEIRFAKQAVSQLVTYDDEDDDDDEDETVDEDAGTVADD